MKIKLFGTGSFTAKSASACAMIDNAILFDCAPESCKKLVTNGFNKTLKAIIISHFHADHDFDLPTVLANVKKPITIIAPRGALTRYRTLCALSHFPEASVMLEKSTVIEIGETELVNGIEINGYKIQPVSVDHFPNLDCYGCTITKDNKTVALSGDAILCNGLQTLLGKADLAVIDISWPVLSSKSQTHMDISDYEQLKKQYPKCHMIPTHMTDNARKNLAKLGHQPPIDNEEYEV